MDKLSQDPWNSYVPRLLPGRVGARSRAGLGYFILLLTLCAYPIWGQGTAHSVTINLASYTQGTDAATGINFYRGTVTGGPYTKLNSAPVTLATTSPVASFIDATGTGGTRYYYVVTAVDATGNESGFSTEVNGVVPANPLIPQGAVTLTIK